MKLIIALIFISLNLFNQIYAAKSVAGGKKIHLKTQAVKAFSQRPDVKQFINEMVKSYNFNKQSLVKLFNTVKIKPKVIKHLRKPLENEPWDVYQRLFITSWNVEEGVKFWNKHANTLYRAEKIYGVPASIIVATIGVETKYGQITGDFRVLDSLSNIAFTQSSRANFFRNELKEFLLLCREAHLNPATLKGSYAGAIGQPQFMPSNYRRYAINFSNSGKIDLYHNEADVIGSIANYYKQKGWEAHEPIAMPAAILGNHYAFLQRIRRLPDKKLTVQNLNHYGLAPVNKIQNTSLAVSVIELPSRFSKEYWLGFHNYEVIKKYNASDLYAVAVYQLSQYLSLLRKQKFHG